MSTSGVSATIDLNAAGKHAGFLKVPHSTNDSAYGWIGVPIVSVRSAAATAPVLLMTGAVHGDEYEGQVALSKLARRLNPDEIRGQVLLLPMTNAPAALAGQRLSPRDDGNLNRLFPGDPMGSPSAVLAHFLETVFIPKADVVIDLHSGGTSLWYPPTLLRGPGSTEDEAARLDRLQAAFDLPFAWVFDSSPGRSSTGRTLMAAANRAGVPCVMAELGGGGVVDREVLARTERGLDRILQAEGILPGGPPDPGQGTRAMRALGSVYAEDSGVLKPVAVVGDRVDSGELVARIHDPEHPLRAPAPVVTPYSGMVLCQRALGRVSVGDAVVQVAEDRDL